MQHTFVVEGHYFLYLVQETFVPCFFGDNPTDSNQQTFHSYKYCCTVYNKQKNLNETLSNFIYSKVTQIAIKIYNILLHKKVYLCPLYIKLLIFIHRNKKTMLFQ